jgi:hypothetical protein
MADQRDRAGDGVQEVPQVGLVILNAAQRVRRHVNGVPGCLQLPAGSACEPVTRPSSEAGLTFRIG